MSIRSIPGGRAVRTVRPAPTVRTSPVVVALPSADSVDWVGAAPFRALLLRLLDDTGLSLAELATHLDQPWPTFRALVTGRPGRPPARRIQPATAAALLRASAEQVLAELRRTVRATSTVTGVRELTARGHTVVEIAARTRLPTALVARLATGRVSTCDGRTRLAVATMVTWSEGQARPAVPRRVASVA